MLMKKRIFALFLCVLMVFSLLSACKKDDAQDDNDTNPNAQNGKVTYAVKVVNGVGQPYTAGMVVTFVAADGTEAMAVVNAEGVASKELAAGEYTLKAASMDNAAISYDTKVKVTAQKPSVDLVVAYVMGEEFETINADSVTMEGNLSYDAYFVKVGSTAVSVTAEDRNYFLFSPTEGGKYEFSVTDNAAVIGIYGASTNYIMSHSTAENVDGKVRVNVSADMIGTGVTGTTTLVIGLDVAEGVKDCVLNIVRVGDTDWSVEQEPWTTYQPKDPITKFTLPAGITLKEFDLTAASDTYKLVLNQQDGYYHLNAVEGPVVYVQLAEPVYGISLMTMVGEIVYGEDGTLMQTGTAPFRYMYSNGPDDFFKEDYTDVMRQYVTERDQATGVYPLNQDLYYILPKGIEQMGWCRSDTLNYLFNGETGINDDIAWMFLLMYEDAPVPEVPDDTQTPDNNENPTTPTTPTNPTNPTTPTTKPTTPATKPTTPTTKPVTKPDPEPEPEPDPDPIEDNKDEPIEIASVLEFDAEVKANHIVYFNLHRYTDAILTISSKDAYIIYKNKTYEAKNGVVTISGVSVASNYQPLKIAIGNKGSKDATFKVKISFPAGHVNNPIKLKEGALTTETAAGNEQGVFYTYTAKSAGKLTIKLNSVTSGVNADIKIDVAHADESVTQLTLEEVGGDTLTIEFKAGETIRVIIGAMPNKNNKYPAATIKTTVTID